MNSNTIAQFYFTCDVNTGLANPFQSHIDDLNTAFTDIQTQLATAQASIPGGCVAPTGDMTTLIALVTALQNAIGPDNSQDPDPSLLYEVSCPGLNSM